VTGRNVGEQSAAVKQSAGPDAHEAAVSIRTAVGAAQRWVVMRARAKAPMTDDEQLLANFVASFARLDDLSAFRETDPAAWALRLGKPGKFGAHSWRPRAVKTARESLEVIYRQLPVRFPALYEGLVLSYRWAEVDLGRFRLLANPRGAGLEGLKSEMFRDTGLTELLLPAGLLQFGKGPDVNYDPVCFRVAGTTPERAPIVRLDHEYLLCDRKLVIVEELARDCRQLMEDVIERARAA